jgi:hypothetical protein
MNTDVKFLAYSVNAILILPLFGKRRFYHAGMSLGLRDLKVGCRYMTNGGYFIRTITAINSNHVDYMDQSGPGCCTRHTFIKRCTHIVTESELNVPSLPPRQAPLVDRAITNKVLESVITLQNQLDTWFKMLDQAMEHYEPVLTPAQIAAHQELSEHAAAFARRLQQHRDFLMQ